MQRVMAKARIEGGGGSYVLVVATATPNGGPGGSLAEDGPGKEGEPHKGRRVRRDGEEFFRKGQGRERRLKNSGADIFTFVRAVFELSSHRRHWHGARHVRPKTLEYDVEVLLNRLSSTRIRLLPAASSHSLRNSSPSSSLPSPTRSRTTTRDGESATLP